MNQSRLGTRWLRSAMIGLRAIGVASGCAMHDPVVDDSNTTRKLGRLKHDAGEQKVVTIYQFRSTVPELSGHSATDMFTTALIKSGAFVVVERQRLNEGVARERQLNARGTTKGTAPEPTLVAAQYIFEGAVTEANVKAEKTGAGGTVRGLGVEASGASATIGLEVRVVDARTGVVHGAVNVRKPVNQAGVSASGVGSFIQSFTKKNLQGADVNLAKNSKEGVDEAVRACIEEAVYELARRYGQ